MTTVRILSLDPETGAERVDVIEHQSPAPLPAAGRRLVLVADQARPVADPTTTGTEN